MTPFTVFVTVLIGVFVALVVLWPKGGSPGNSNAPFPVWDPQPHHARFCRKCGRGL